MKVIKYPRVWQRITLAVAASLFILFYGRPLDIIGSFGMPEFYPIFLLSSVISLIMIETVHQFTVWLDRRDPWTDKKPERAILQFTLCVQLPIAFDIFVFTVHFQSIGQEITTSGFFDQDFPLICCFILVLNAYYITRFYMDSGHNQISLQQKNTLIKENESELTCSDLLRVHYNGTAVNLNLASDILYFTRNNHIVKVLTVNGNSYQLPYTLTQITDAYGQIGFCQINRSTVVNLTAVKGYQNGEKRNTLQLIIKPQYQEFDGIDEKLVVTKDKIEQFKQFFDAI
ncbi:LytTR family DNA-binding domain-containing protein [Pedobacter sp.]|uniref:LytTR family DNA-binding domain-containing protein n=1 Tax=Pedobacter sp. TaxID=1411316 RepID=UPI00396C4D66